MFDRFLMAVQKRQEQTVIVMGNDRSGLEGERALVTAQRFVFLAEHFQTVGEIA